jgi:hypothetical protein
MLSHIGTLVFQTQKSSENAALSEYWYRHYPDTSKSHRLGHGGGMMPPPK